MLVVGQPEAFVQTPRPASTQLTSLCRANCCCAKIEQGLPSSLVLENAEKDRFLLLPSATLPGRPESKVRGREFFYGRFENVCARANSPPPVWSRQCVFSSSLGTVFSVKRISAL